MNKWNNNMIQSKIKLTQFFYGIPLLFLTFSCQSNKSSDEQKDLSNINIVEEQKDLSNELKNYVDTIFIDNSDLSSIIQNRKSLDEMLTQLKNNDVESEELYYSFNTLILKLYLRHTRNGCAGHNVISQRNVNAKWMINKTINQLTNGIDDSTFVHSGFIYYAIKNDSINLPHDSSVFNDIKLRIDSCENYDETTYPKNFRP